MRQYLQHVVSIGTYQLTTTQVKLDGGWVLVFLRPGVFLLFPYSHGYLFSEVSSESLRNLLGTLFSGKPCMPHFFFPVFCDCWKLHLSLHFFSIGLSMVFLYLHCLWTGKCLEEMYRAHLLDLSFSERSCYSILAVLEAPDFWISVMRNGEKLCFGILSPGSHSVQLLSFSFSS